MPLLSPTIPKGALAKEVGPDRPQEALRVLHGPYWRAYPLNLPGPQNYAK